MESGVTVEWLGTEDGLCWRRRGEGENSLRGWQ